MQSIISFATFQSNSIFNSKPTRRDIHIRKTRGLAHRLKIIAEQIPIIITGNIFNIKMKRDYSFNEMSHATLSQLDIESRANQPPHFTSSKQSRDSWTDKRVEQIKRKYDTPSHRKNHSHLPAANQKSREPLQESNSNNPYSSYRNALKDSAVVSGGQRKDPSTSLNNNFCVSNSKGQEGKKPTWQQEEHVPRFSYDSKQNNNFMEKFAYMKNSMKPESRLNSKQIHPGKFRDYPGTSKIGPRVQHIDEINMKIKKILDCLHENQNQGRFAQDKPMKNSFMKSSLISKGQEQPNQLEQTKIISRQQISFQRQPANPAKSSVIKQQPVARHSLSPQVRHNSSTRWRLEEKYANIKNSNSVLNDSISKTPQQAEEPTDSWFQPNRNKDSRSRARSCLGNFRNEQIKLNSGKKLDDQISKINVRIRQFEEEKRKLNIEFKPYTYEMKSNKSTSNLIEHRTQRGAKPPKSTKNTEYSHSYYRVQEKVKTQASEYEPIRYTLDTRKSMNGAYEYKPLSRINSSSFRVEAIESLNREQRREKSSTPEFQHKEQEITKQEPKIDKLSQQLKQKAQQGIEERKRKLLDTATVTFSRETKRLITNMFEQVKLDEQLRNAKIWYRDLMNPKKQQLLRNQIQKLGLQVGDTQFQVTEQEDNPFYSVRQSDQSFRCLIERWVKSQSYWKQNISGQYNLRQFTTEKFTVDKVDLQKKGYFVIEDLVRFLNMETGTFYRNRDLILIFRRLTSSNKLPWQQFLAKLELHQ